MSKSILLSIRPEWVAKILNGEKTIEVRKRFPKDYVGWVYIYCTKDRKTKLSSNSLQYYVVDNKDYKDYLGNWNGKVVARFWCDKVEEISAKNIESFTKDSCLTVKQIEDYLWKNICNGYAIHISKLEIFDEPKELSEFKFWKDKSEYGCWYENKLTKAPQNYCYIEGEE